MLETVREFALEQLVASGEEAVVQDAHAAYFLALAERAAPQLHTEHQQAWLERLQAEHANLREVLVRAEQSGNVCCALRLAAALWRFWHRRGYWAEGLSWLNRLLALAAPSTMWISPHGQERSRAPAGWLTTRTTSPRPKLPWRKALSAIAVSGGLTAWSRCSIARHWSPSPSARTGERRNWARRRSPFPALPAITPGSPSHSATSAGQRASSGNTSERPPSPRKRWSSIEQRGIAAAQAVALMVLGDVARDLGHTADARDLCQESLAIFRELGEPLGEGFSLNNLALAAYGEGDLDLARSLGEESLAIFRRVDVRNAMVDVLPSLGAILDAAGGAGSSLGRADGGVAAGSASRTAMGSGCHPGGHRQRGRRSRAGPHGRRDGQRAAALRTEIGVPVRPNLQADLDRTLAKTRAALGEEAFDGCLDPRP